MAIYVQYEIKEGQVLLVEMTAMRSGMIEAAGGGANSFLESKVKFEEAIRAAKASAKALITELDELPVDEMEVTFGLKSVGEAGFFAVGKVGLEANYQVKLTWKKPRENSETS